MKWRRDATGNYWSDYGVIDRMFDGKAWAAKVFSASKRPVFLRLRDAKAYCEDLVRMLQRGQA